MTIKPTSDRAHQEAHARPAGELGGHTVQDLEQVGTRTRTTSDPPTESLTSTSGSRTHEQASALADPSPEVEPIYLRTIGAMRDPTPGRASDGSETLADAITRTVLEHLALTLHASVTEAVRSLVPRLRVTLGSDASSAAELSSDPAATPALESARMQDEADSGSEAATT